MNPPLQMFSGIFSFQGTIQTTLIFDCLQNGFPPFKKKQFTVHNIF